VLLDLLRQLYLLLAVAAVAAAAALLLLLLLLAVHLLCHRLEEEAAH
jgi:hypothetical protein